MTYQRQLVWCGKDRCRTCPHGPYWYAFYWESALSPMDAGRAGRKLHSGKVRSKYIGRDLEKGIARAGRGFPPARDATVNDTIVVTRRPGRRKK